MGEDDRCVVNIFPPTNELAVLNAAAKPFVFSCPETVSYAALHTAAVCCKAGESCEALLRDGDTLDWVTLEGVACSSFSASNEQAGQLLQVLTAAQEADVRTRMCIEALYYAVVANRPDTIRDFVALDADVKYRRSDWLPYLHRVASRGLPKAIEALLQAGANVEARYNGSTYLHFACDHFHANVIQMLLYWGAEESSTDPDINTP